MWKDPIVAEIHAVREQIAKRFDYDLERIVEYLRAKEALHPERLVDRSGVVAESNDRAHDADRKDAA